MALQVSSIYLKLALKWKTAAHHFFGLLSRHNVLIAVPCGECTIENSNLGYFQIENAVDWDRISMAFEKFDKSGLKILEEFSKNLKEMIPGHGANREPLGFAHAAMEIRQTWTHVQPTFVEMIAITTTANNIAKEMNKAAKYNSTSRSPILHPEEEKTFQLQLDHLFGELSDLVPSSGSQIGSAFQALEKRAEHGSLRRIHVVLREKEKSFTQLPNGVAKRKREEGDLHSGHDSDSAAS